ncbi:D-sedoheptulose-7-phosphate isomerase [Humibacter albus]|jgi:phosphoheptose isomerase|uniref:D-sedoheptulose-7-phosphate isomerase n=1 Tax=Humibacter albus TaxID=427754 RepID=UPI00042A2C01|nr:SIS domain-containing protein [Humibacter albus]
MTSIETPTRQVPSLASDHIDTLGPSLTALRRQAAHLGEWGELLAGRLHGGARLLVAGNGGSAAEAQHLTAELVGRFQDDRPAFSALALSAETSSLTAIGNDYGFDEVFARQVRAHARPGDIVLLLSTSGASENLISAAAAAHWCGALVWAMTGPLPNPLAAAVDDVITVDGASAHVQECELVAIHALCRVFDSAIDRLWGTAP